MECSNIDKQEAKSITLLLTNSCNLNCVYCYERFKKSNSMTFETAKKAILEEFQGNQFKVFNIEFMGGEPLLEFNLVRQISEWLWSQDFEQKYTLFVVSNGTLLTKEMKEWFYTNKDRISIGLSLDGDSETQNSNRSNSWYSIDLDFFRETWPHEGIKMTISKQSLPKLANNVILFEKLGFKRIQANLAYMDGWEESDLVIWNNELAKLAEFYVKHHLECHCSLLDIKPDCIFVEKAKNKRCGCGHYITCIDTDGKKYPCQMFAPISMPSNIYSLVNNTNFDDDSIFYNEKCNKCVLKVSCPACCGNNLIHKGGLNIIDDFYCKAFMVQYLRNVEYQIMKAQEIKDPSERDTLIADLQTMANSITLN